MPRRKPPVIADTLLDQLTASSTLWKALAGRALNAELDHHLVNREPDNSRNGYGRTTGTGRIELEIPRDGAGSFDPALIAKRPHSASIARLRSNMSVRR